MSALIDCSFFLFNNSNEFIRAIQWCVTEIFTILTNYTSDSVSKKKKHII